jgi:ornithine carbamoyltransferase
LSLREYSRAELEEIFDLARKVKARPGDHADALKRKALAMAFQKPSTRTRVSFEMGCSGALHTQGKRDVIGRHGSLTQGPQVR